MVSLSYPRDVCSFWTSKSPKWTKIYQKQQKTSKIDPGGFLVIIQHTYALTSNSEHAYLTFDQVWHVRIPRFGQKWPILDPKPLPVPPGDPYGTPWKQAIGSPLVPRGSSGPPPGVPKRAKKGQKPGSRIPRLSIWSIFGHNSTYVCLNKQWRVCKSDISSFWRFLSKTAKNAKMAFSHIFGSKICTWWLSGANQVDLGPYGVPMYTAKCSRYICISYIA